MCVQILGNNKYERTGCGIAPYHYGETLPIISTWLPQTAWSTQMGYGLKGYIKSVYIWDTYKAPTNLHYTPRRNQEYRRLD